MPDPPQPTNSPPRVVWREDFVPPAPLFQIPGHWTLVTEAPADRVMRAGFSDVIFIDYANDGTRHNVVYRQLTD